MSEKIYDPIELGARFKSIRDKAKMGQVEFGKKIGASQPRLSDIEQGKAMPDIPILQALLKIFKVAPLWLMTGEGEQSLTEKPGSGSSSSSAYDIEVDRAMIKTLVAKLKEVEARMQAVEEEIKIGKFLGGNLN